MSDSHIDILRDGVTVWNKWRHENPKVTPNLACIKLRDADLDGINLENAIIGLSDFRGSSLRNAKMEKSNCLSSNFESVRFDRAKMHKASLGHTKCRGASFVGADLLSADLSHADLSRANLTDAQLVWTRMYSTNLRQGVLVNANLDMANLNRAKLSKARLSGANLIHAHLVESDLSGADITGCRVYGVSAWNLMLDGCKQSDLVITRPEESPISVDNLEVAQFVYLMLNNKNIRRVIDTIASKAVLILGRFTLKRKLVLDGLRTELRKHDLLPILFDFDRPSSRNLTETVSTLAHMSRFVIADITEAKSIPQELQKIIPDLPSLPIQPILQGSFRQYSMFSDFFDYASVLPPHRYDSINTLLAELQEKIITPPIARLKEIRKKREERERLWKA